MGGGVITRFKAATGRLALHRRLAHGADVPVQRDEVLAAQPELLLIDGSGPVFSPHPAGTLREQAFRAAFHAEAG